MSMAMVDMSNIFRLPHMVFLLAFSAYVCVHVERMSPHFSFSLVRLSANRAANLTAMNCLTVGSRMYTKTNLFVVHLLQNIPF